jgi:hypothetical protein
MGLALWMRSGSVGGTEIGGSQDGRLRISGSIDGTSAAEMKQAVRLKEGVSNSR